MNLQEIDLLRIQANKRLDPNKRSELGQFFTPTPIAEFMASLFNNIKGSIRLLEPGCGIGSLIAAFVQELIRRNTTIKEISVMAYDIEPIISEYFESTMSECKAALQKKMVQFNYSLSSEDFIFSSEKAIQTLTDGFYSHVIMNPPYKKINANSEHRKSLSKVGIETVNLYSAFVALAIKRLRKGGELVAIIPRSFCNGPYYEAFRHILLEETAIRHIHIFQERDSAFGDEVLQENVIIHCEKGAKQSKVKITCSPKADFDLDEETQEFVASDTTIRSVSFDSIVKPNDKHKFIHIAPTESEQQIIDALSCFASSLEDINIEVSTGAVVDFRMKAHLSESPKQNHVPLIYPHHLNRETTWPVTTKRPDSIAVNEETKSFLWGNLGYYVIVNRFSSKEEKRRIVASIYNSKDFDYNLVGFDNKLNAFHWNKSGLDRATAAGLFIFLNSTLIDKYYRQFGGHTQVNASDLRSLLYPSIESLRRIGKSVKSFQLSQSEIDDVLSMEIYNLTGNQNITPLKANEKIEQALDVLRSLGMPKAQHNERSALTLLALLNLEPSKLWKDIERPQIGVTPIMEWCKEIYHKEYAPNTRETFRRQTLHQLVAAGIVLYNPDDPSRAVNSPKACYQVVPEVFDLLINYGTPSWSRSLGLYLATQKTLAEKYAMEREMHMIPIKLNDEVELKLSAGAHSELIRDIVLEFAPRFAPESQLIYLGDTGSKEGFFERERLAKLGIKVDDHGKMPDVVLYYPKKKWLLLIEAVTSHGPVDSKRHEELIKLFKDSKVGLVFVTAFPNKKIMAKYLPDISWETEVWVAEAPTHMIHFNGERFLGPY